MKLSCGIFMSRAALLLLSFVASHTSAAYTAIRKRAITVLFPLVIPI